MLDTRHVTFLKFMSLVKLPVIHQCSLDERLPGNYPGRFLYARIKMSSTSKVPVESLDFASLTGRWHFPAPDTSSYRNLVLGQIFQQLLQYAPNQAGASPLHLNQCMWT